MGCYQLENKAVIEFEMVSTCKEGILHYPFRDAKASYCLISIFDFKYHIPEYLRHYQDLDRTMLTLLVEMISEAGPF